jgi:hypothetical protein
VAIVLIALSATTDQSRENAKIRENMQAQQERVKSLLLVSGPSVNPPQRTAELPKLRVSQTMLVMMHAWLHPCQEATGQFRKKFLKK